MVLFLPSTRGNVMAKATASKSKTSMKAKTGSQEDRNKEAAAKSIRLSTAKTKAKKK